MYGARHVKCYWAVGRTYPARSAPEQISDDVLSVNYFELCPGRKTIFNSTRLPDRRREVGAVVDNRKQVPMTAARAVTGRVERMARGRCDVVYSTGRSLAVDGSCNHCKLGDI